MSANEIHLLQSEEASIVLVGSFNPLIFHPEWFIKHKIVSEFVLGENDDEALIHHDLTKFSFESGIRLEVFKNKFIVRTPFRTEFKTLRDLVISTFTVLAETPIYQMGMNYKCVSGSYSDSQWKSFGSHLTNLDHWKSIFEHTKTKKVSKLDKFGLFSQKIMFPRNDDYNGAIFFEMGASGMLNDKNLSFTVNNHIEFEGNGVKRVPEILESIWDDSIEESISSIRNLIKLEKKD